MYNNLPKFFEKKLRINIGLYLVEAVESPHLKIGTTLANFNSFGKNTILKGSVYETCQGFNVTINRLFSSQCKEFIPTSTGVLH